MAAELAVEWWMLKQQPANPRFSAYIGGAKGCLGDPVGALIECAEAFSAGSPFAKMMSSFTIKAAADGKSREAITVYRSLLSKESDAELVAVFEKAPIEVMEEESSLADLAATSPAELLIYYVAELYAKLSFHVTPESIQVYEAVAPL